MPTKTLNPLPETTLEVTPTAEQVEFFADNGYLVVDRITTDEELEWLTDLYGHIFSPEQAGEPGAPVDRSYGANDETPGFLNQAFFPEMQYPQLLQATYHRNARRYAAALLGVDIGTLSSWGHMIRKLPGGREAPWHQDEAYWDPEFTYHALGCWLPLHAVSEEMGAMQFIPGPHKKEGLRHHRHVDDDAVLHVLVADGVDTSRAVACPLAAGGATFHHQRTLHYTAVNQTTRPRLAFPTEFQTAPHRVAEPEHRPWVDAHRAATGRTAATSYPADARFVPY